MSQLKLDRIVVLSDPQNAADVNGLHSTLERLSCGVGPKRGSLATSTDFHQQAMKKLENDCTCGARAASGATKPIEPKKPLQGKPAIWRTYQEVSEMMAAGLAGRGAMQKIQTLKAFNWLLSDDAWRQAQSWIRDCRAQHGENLGEAIENGTIEGGSTAVELYSGGASCSSAAAMSTDAVPEGWEKRPTKAESTKAASTADRKSKVAKWFG